MKDKVTMGAVEMQKARAIKCGKNRRRRRRSTGSHDQSSSVSEEEGDGSTRRGKRRLRKSRSLSFGSSADSHDDVEHDGHRCVRFNPVPEVHVFSNRADKRKWKELRRQQSLNGNKEFDSIQPKTDTDKICKLKSSLKDTRNHNVSSDNTNTVTDGDLTESNACEDTDKYVFIDDDDGGNCGGDDDNDDDGDENQNDDDDNSFVKLEKPQLTNPLIFDLDD